MSQRGTEPFMYPRGLSVILGAECGREVQIHICQRALETPYLARTLPQVLSQRVAKTAPSRGALLSERRNPG